MGDVQSPTPLSRVTLLASSLTTLCRALSPRHVLLCVLSISSLRFYRCARGPLSVGFAWRMRLTRGSLLPVCLCHDQPLHQVRRGRPPLGRFRSLLPEQRSRVSFDFPELQTGLHRSAGRRTGGRWEEGATVLASLCEALFGKLQFHLSVNPIR